MLCRQIAFLHPRPPPRPPKLCSRRRGLHSVFTRALDTSQLKGGSIEQLTPWFAEMGALLDKYDYAASNIFNMDQTGSAIGNTQSTRVISIINTKACKAKPPRGEWVTSIECISAAGRLLPPLFVSKGTSAFNPAWLPTGMSREDDRI